MCVRTYARDLQATQTRIRGLLHPDLSHAVSDRSSGRVSTAEGTRIRDTAATLTHTQTTRNSKSNDNEMSLSFYVREIFDNTLCSALCSPNMNFDYKTHVTC